MIPEPRDLLALARDVALEAAALVADLRRHDVAVTATKSSPIDVVTEADRASEELIRRRLLDARPDDGFLGEEGDSRDSSSGVTWVVDPIDGTVNFLYGIPQYAVSVAARLGDRQDDTVAGVVVDVAKGECFTATRGGGARLDGRPIGVRDVVPMAHRLVATGFHYTQQVRAEQARAAERLLGEVRDVRRLGSAALDLCWVGAGRIDAYVEEGLHEWDLAAGGLVATEAGAHLEVRPGGGGKPCVLAAPTGGFTEFAALVERSGFLADRAGISPERPPLV